MACSESLPLGLLVQPPYGGQNLGGKALILATVVDAASAIRWTDLGLDPILYEIGPVKIRWYSLAYICGILFGWWYLLKMVAQPGAPMAKRHVDDFIFYATLGIILGGRLGYCIFYKPEIFLKPQEVFYLWNGGMSFHGGVLGVVLAILYYTRKEKLNWLRFHDYVACVYPVGHFFARLANFVNHELWGKPTDAPWGVIFPDAGEIARHPSQLYQAGLEGLVLAAILWFLFFKTQARYEPGKLVGAFTALMGIFRFGLEFVREPDAGVTGLLGMSMGQTLSIPMVLVGGYLFFTAKGRRQRVESLAGANSVA
jgi:phosphatidylglycerol---prolipoprotein diacylglyceryl transferase